MTDFEWAVLQDIADYWCVGVHDIAPVDIKLYWEDVLQSSNPIKVVEHRTTISAYSKLFPF